MKKRGEKKEIVKKEMKNEREEIGRRMEEK